MVQDLNSTFQLVRTVIFGTVTVFAFIVLALCASITNYTSTYYYGGYFPFAALGIAVAVLTLLTLPAMLYLSLNRKGAFTSLTGLEFGWTSFLWILWLALGGNSAGILWLGDCGYWLTGKGESMCRQSQAVTAFGFLNWIALFAYNITLLVLLIRQQMRGNSVWNGYITETDFAAPGPNSAVPSNKVPEAGFAPQYQAPAVVPVYPTQQYQGAPPQTTSPHPQV
ncbi:hypothetical protein M413DRAFT_444461 [Hebeloma cylindrosporum]|uniref:MARVEL domain-containing protein n=1 Tax=Hebeloma cylindrosporum TaxID=76867 RepID=A0A0C2XYV5_HEBCY|nr:hypothetical protein M413DRAFT_444461 [Hebeloma cylindrosporum h7]